MGRYDETRQEIHDNIDRIRSLAEAENLEEVEALSAETDQLIRSLPTRERTKLRNALREAASAEPEKGTDVVRTEDDYTKIEGVSELVSAGAAKVLEGVKLNIKASDMAREVAELLLDMRRRITNDRGVPDLRAYSQAARDAASAMYQAAGQQLDGDLSQEDVEDAVLRWARAVRRQMSDVQARYVRELDNSPEEATHFSFAMDKYPDLPVSEAVWRYYEDIGQPLPRKGATEIAREKAARQRELARAAETGEEPAEAPIERATTAVRTVRKTIRRVHVEDFSKLPDDEKAAVRSELEETLEAIKAMIKATLD